ncbi:MAG: DoxX family protein [Planctomycetaceae bacterium]|nr:MAG: DoxX family protein [Planctomycetaceae bacterium]
MSLSVFLTPLRLATGWGPHPRLLSGIGVVMLILMRLTLGWHFFSEGHEKWRQGDWDAAPFFLNARGPLAVQFRQMVWDYDGSLRLDVDKTKQHFAVYRDKVAKHYGFDEAQKRQAQANYAKSIEGLEFILASNATDLEEYELGRKRIQDLKRESMREGVPSLAGQAETIRTEWRLKITPVLREIDALWASYQQAQTLVATTSQVADNGELKLGVPRNQFMDTSVVNRWIPYFDMTIGICLVLGLFTPIASLAGAAFLGSVFLSQFPPVTGLGSSYQLIECMACLVLAGTAAGRFAGLDFFFHAWLRKPLTPTAE